MRVGAGARLLAIDCIWGSPVTQAPGGQASAWPGSLVLREQSEGVKLSRAGLRGVAQTPQV